MSVERRRLIDSQFVFDKLPLEEEQTGNSSLIVLHLFPDNKEKLCFLRS